MGEIGSEKREYKNHYLQLYYCVKFYVKNDFGPPGDLLYIMTSIFIHKRYFPVS